MVNKILKLTANGAFEEIEVTNERVEYKELREAVGGYIEHVTFNRELVENGIDVWVDEKGKLKELPVGCMVLDADWRMIECLAGPLVFTSCRNSEEKIDGESYALTDEQMSTIKEVLKEKVFGCVRIMPYK